MSFRIGLDISGGDYAPFEPIKGALLALDDLTSSVVLIGTNEDFEKAKDKNISIDKFEVVRSKEKIEMDESPASSIRKKKESSIVIGTNLVKEGYLDAFVSCGNTGAVVCASVLNIGLIGGIERPGIAILVPTIKDVSLIIDAGANIDPKPLHLFQYGIMASVYYSLVLGKENPTVGLLNIGEESSKGPEFVRKTHQLFANSSLNFIGNLEAKDVFFGKCNCIICDGYVGNVALKVSEGFAEAMGRFLLDNIRNDFFGRIGILFIKRSLKKFKKLIDYAEYGGAPLLGINSVVIIGHGRSSAYAIKNALKVAEKELKRNLIHRIKRRIDEISQNSRVGEIFTS